ncbi:enoyl-CoA hydratase/isomerase family protein [Streptomyces sp. NPDC086082]|uniref:enoyl-CoA hydratase/isomerase family protein n=1 Tax=Streptomyces sp. NPDC086082 TaxID=3365750 RepID=UPI0037F6F3E3
MSGTLIEEEAHGRVRVLRINRPEVHNALNDQVLAQLGDTIGRLGSDGSTRAVVVTGTGAKAFSAGADLEALATMDAREAHRFLRAGQHALRQLELSGIPVIAAVNGVALGGGFELALACSFSMLSETASLGLPEASLGLIPGFGGTQRLVRAVGPAIARYLMLTGRSVDAWRAHQIGLSVLPPAVPEELVPAAVSVAEEISRRGPQACRSILQSVREGQDAPLDTGLALEAALAAMAVGGPEATEGIDAFRSRRAPDFDGVPAAGKPHLGREST